MRTRNYLARIRMPTSAARLLVLVAIPPAAAWSSSLPSRLLRAGLVKQRPEDLLLPASAVQRVAQPEMIAVGPKLIVGSALASATAFAAVRLIGTTLRRRHLQFRDLSILCEQSPTLDECELLSYQSKTYTSIGWWRKLTDRSLAKKLEAAEAVRKLAGSSD